MAITTDPVRALAAITGDSKTARWNFPAAIGSSVDAPGGIGTAVSVTFSFLAQEPAYDPGQVGFQAFTPAQQDAARLALTAIAAVCGISFNEVGAADGMIAFGGNDQDPSLAGYAFYPNYGTSSDSLSKAILSVTEDPLGGTVWINTDYAADDGSPGSEAYATLLHEIGHAIGLKHPFEANGGDTLSTALDNEACTLMSYTVAPRSLIYDLSGTPESYSYTLGNLSPTTLMSFDIAALQYLYGANSSTHSGNTVYSWGVNEELLETIWDGGGVDTIDCANQILRCVVNLNAGAFSSIALRRTDAEIRSALGLPDWFTETLDPDTYNGSNNLCIAFNCAIENAVGGSAADSLTGNALANTLIGALGDDTLLGAAGADTLIGGSGADSLNGGTGNDRLEGGDGDDVYTVDTAGDLLIEATASGLDRVLSGVSYALAPNLEQLALTGSAAINGTGNGLNNLLTGNGGANVLKGLAGIDSLTGGAGNDQLFGGSANDILTGGNGNDRFIFDGALGTSNIDHVTDFARGLDRLVLDDDIFARLGVGTATGTSISSANFKVGAAASDSNDYLIYNPTTDKLLYDSDGNGTRAAMPIATIPLAGTMALAASDFLLVA